MSPTGLSFGLDPTQFSFDEWLALWRKAQPGILAAIKKGLKAMKDGNVIKWKSEGAKEPFGMTDLELRQQMAQVLGWTEIDVWGTVGIVWGNRPGDEKGRVRPCPEWEQSLDACLRDAGPVAKEMGYYTEITILTSGSWVTFIGSRSGRNGTSEDADTAAYCLAFIALKESMVKE